MDETKKSQIYQKNKKKKLKPKRKLSLGSLQPMGMTTETNVFERMANKTVKDDAVDKLDAICKEKSYNRILICDTVLSFILLFISTSLAVVAYIAKQSSSPIVIFPNVTKSDLMEGN